jgi:hypothetical protein
LAVTLGWRKNQVLSESSRSSEQKNNRLFAANQSKAKVITMGDLNDGPYNKSVKIALGAKAIKTDVLRSIYNPFEEMAKRGLGTIAFRDSWDF